MKKENTSYIYTYTGFTYKAVSIREIWFKANDLTSHSAAAGHHLAL